MLYLLFLDYINKDQIHIDDSNPMNRPATPIIRYCFITPFGFISLLVLCFNYYTSIFILYFISHLIPSCPLSLESHSQIAAYQQISICRRSSHRTPSLSQHSTCTIQVDLWRRQYSEYSLLLLIFTILFPNL